MDMFIDQLQGIPIAGNDEELLLRRSPGGQSPNDIIRFKTFQLQNRDPQSIQHFPSHWELFRQFRRGGFALGFVGGIFLVPKCPLSLVESDHHARRLQIGHQFDDHVGKTKHGIRELSTGSRQGGQGIECPMNQTTTVDDNKFGIHRASS